MRFVSVVVPDWLIATIRVSRMSERSPKPESSVAGRASTRRRPSGIVATSAEAKLWPATWAVP